MLTSTAPRGGIEGTPALPLPPRPWRDWGAGPGLIISAVAIGLAALLPVPLNLAVGVVPAVLLVCLRWPLGALYALAFSVPFQTVRDINAGGLQLTSTEVLIALATVAWLVRAASRSRFDLPPLPWTTALYIFGGAMLLSVSQASDLHLSLKELLKWAEMLLTYVIIVSMARSPRAMPRLFMLLLLAGVAEALVGFAQVLVHGGGVFHAAGVLRAAGTFDQPNPFAGFLNMSLPLALAALLVGLPRYRRLAWTSLVLTGVAVLVSLSRGAWLATVVAAITVAWLGRPRWRAGLFVSVGTVALMVVGSALGIVPGGLADELASLFGLSKIDVINPTPVTWSTAERLAHWLAGLAMFQAHPVLGVGIGNYPAVYKQYQVAPVWEFPLGHAHNYYINMAAEAGIVGLIAYLLFLGLTLRLCVRLWRSATTVWARAIGLGALGVIITTAVQGFFDNVFVHGMEVQVALVVALVALGERFARSSGDDGSAEPGDVLAGLPPDGGIADPVRAGRREYAT
ncbi:MAG: O-antigen ligase family protein [Chloroflexota bacterium]